MESTAIITLGPRSKGTFDLRRLWRAAAFSYAGLRAAFAGEAAFRLELALAAVMIPLAFYVTAAPLARALLVGSVLFVLVVEVINSAIEAVVDRISLDRHELAGRAKDLGSAAVFLSLVNVVAVWLIVLFG